MYTYVYVVSIKNKPPTAPTPPSIDTGPLYRAPAPTHDTYRNSCIAIARDNFTVPAESEVNVNSRTASERDVRLDPSSLHKHQTHHPPRFVSGIIHHANHVTSNTSHLLHLIPPWVYSVASLTSCKFPSNRKHFFFLQKNSDISCI
ncbi:hypothetical protein ABW21_db0208530 [Orbilia brochopaga]|nr:hypothetical protein ABW21_db0208530 [Drechslerella brochopaga]